MFKKTKQVLVLSYILSMPICWASRCWWVISCCQQTQVPDWRHVRDVGGWRGNVTCCWCWRPAVARQRDVTEWRHGCGAEVQVSADDATTKWSRRRGEKCWRYNDCSCVIECLVQYVHLLSVVTGNISGTGRVIDFVFDSSLGFSGMTELLLVVPSPRWQLATILEMTITLKRFIQSTCCLILS